jgi:hypothetical protein
MRRKLLVVAGIFVALAILILMIDLQPSSPPRVEMGFYGFTNSGARVEALFGISNHPNLSVVLHSVSRLGTNAPDSNAPPMGTWAWGRWEPWGITSAVSIKTTDEPLRVVFEFQERAGGLRRIPERIKELWGKLTGNEREFFTGSKFLVTNETCILSASR